ncbi:hypothetical protein ANO11243_016300 [Dothideomycetidae sp. 11243]|nr:hypothetical protein ANO11243_016300 [fungal sp. No.11243]
MPNQFHLKPAPSQVNTSSITTPPPNSAQQAHPEPESGQLSLLTQNVSDLQSQVSTLQASVVHLQSIVQHNDIEARNAKAFVMNALTAQHNPASELHPLISVLTQAPIEDFPRNADEMRMIGGERADALLGHLVPGYVPSGAVEEKRRAIGRAIGVLDMHGGVVFHASR